MTSHDDGTPLEEDNQEAASAEPVQREEMENGDDKHAAEHYRLAGRPPLVTILILSIGPIISQAISALCGTIDTIWISKAVGEIGMTAVATYTAFDNIGRAFGFFTSIAGSSKISALFGAGKEEEASQVICDLIRVCILSGIIVPAILAPLVKIGVRWFGANEEVVELGFSYMFPLLMCTVFTCWFVTGSGFLQAEGRSILSGAIQIAALVLNMAVFDPLFLLGFNMGLPGAAWARIASELIAALVILGLFFAGKFAVKPKFRQLFKKFSPETIPSLKVGLSQLVSNISVSIPGIIVRKLIGMQTDISGYRFNDVLAGYNVVFRYAQITNNIIIGLTMGYLPAASYSYAAKNYKRWLALSIHLNWLSFMWGTITAVLSWSIPYQISLIFSDGLGYLRWAGPMTQVGNCLGFVIFGRFCFPSMLQGIQRGLTSTLLSLASQLVSIIVIALILFYAVPGDPVVVVYCYGISYVFGLLLGAVVLFFPFRDIIREMKKSSDEDEVELEEDVKEL